MKIDTAGRIIGSFLVVTAYFIILHVNLSLGVIMQFVGDAISVPFFIRTKSWDVVIMLTFLLIISSTKLIPVSWLKEAAIIHLFRLIWVSTITMYGCIHPAAEEMMESFVITIKHSVKSMFVIVMLKMLDGITLTPVKQCKHGEDQFVRSMRH